MHGVAHEAVLIYCECAATKQIGLPGGEKDRKKGFKDSRGQGFEYFFLTI
jgi:hypothetical protein